MVMAAKLTRLSHKVAIQLHLVAESCTICSTCPMWPVWELSDTPLWSFQRFFVPHFYIKKQIVESLCLEKLLCLIIRP